MQLWFSWLGGFSLLSTSFYLQLCFSGSRLSLLFLILDMAEDPEAAPVVNKNKRHRKEKRTSAATFLTSSPGLSFMVSLGHG